MRRAYRSQPRRLRCPVFYLISTVIIEPPGPLPTAWRWLSGARGGLSAAGCRRSLCQGDTRPVSSVDVCPYPHTHGLPAAERATERWRTEIVALPAFGGGSPPLISCIREGS